MEGLLALGAPGIRTESKRKVIYEASDIGSGGSGGVDRVRVGGQSTEAGGGQRARNDQAVAEFEGNSRGIRDVGDRDGLALAADLAGRCDDPLREIQKIVLG